MANDQSRDCSERPTRRRVLISGAGAKVSRHADPFQGTRMRMSSSLRACIRLFGLFDRLVPRVDLLAHQFACGLKVGWRCWLYRDVLKPGPNRGIGL